MEITLSNGKKLEILGINFRNNTIDFKWVDGVYGGECCFPMIMQEGVIPSIEDIEQAANSELVTEE